VTWVILYLIIDLVQFLFVSLLIKGTKESYSTFLVRRPVYVL